MRWRLCGLFVLFLLTWKCSGTSLTLNNKYLPGKVLRSIEHSSLFDCSASCDEDSKCLSFNFIAFTLVCELNSETGSDADLVTKKRSYFSKKKRTNTGPCSEMTCTESHVCHVNRGHNQPTCVPRDADLESDVTQNCYDVKRTNSTDGQEVQEVNNQTVYCDMTTDCGGWRVFQRKMDGSVDFNRMCLEYKNGFGNVTGEFWLGNEEIHQITNEKSYELRIDMEDNQGNKEYATYSTFTMDSEDKAYGIHTGQCSSNEDDSANNFCKVRNGGVWWFEKCNHAFETTKYNLLKDLFTNEWGKDVTSYKTFQMKIRPI